MGYASYFLRSSCFKFPRRERLTYSSGCRLHVLWAIWKSRYSQLRQHHQRYDPAFGKGQYLMG
jgi:hypothetical protein